MRGVPVRIEVSACLLAGLLVGTVGSEESAWGVQAPVAGRTLEITGHLEAREVIEANGSTAEDRTFEQFSARLRYPTSGVLALESAFTVQNGGPTSEHEGAGPYNLDDVFQSRSPAVECEEAFLDAHLARVDLRIGKQKIAWGKLDRVQPVDLLNPERYTDPFMLEEDERKIGVPAVQASYFLPPRAWIPEEARPTAVWVPQYVPFRFPRPGERWFSPAAMPPDTFFVPADVFPLPGGGTNPSFAVPVGFRARNVPSPALRLENSGYAARFAGFSGGVDYALYYYHGFDALPAFRMTAEALAAPDPGSLLGFRFAARTELTPIFRTIDMWGADAAYAAGDVSLRAEAAFINGRPFSRDLRFLIDDPQRLAPQIREAVTQFQQGSSSVPVDLGASFVERDAVEWGIGADYDLSGTLLLLQVNQTDVLDNQADLLIKDIETRLLANLRKNFWHDSLAMQLVAQHALESDYTLWLPRLTYRVWESIELRVGYLYIAGRRSSVGGQYKRNDQAFVRVRYLF